jgi:ElaB/YqjD/DUF883 family membrane-anchored ribosome-binding protein
LDGPFLAEVLRTEVTVMATMTGTAAAKELLQDRFGPALEALEENVREARRAMTNGRHAVEDFVTGTGLQVRRHPLSALAVTAGAGALAGYLIGFAIGRRSVRS